MAKIVKTDDPAKTSWAATMAALESRTAREIAESNAKNAARYASAEVIYEPWNNLTTNPWMQGDVVSVGGNRMWGGYGLKLPLYLEAGQRMVARWSITITQLGSNMFGGVSNAPIGVPPGASADQNGFFIGIDGNTASVFGGSNLIASDAPATPAGGLAAGTYTCTCIIDETHVSLSLQSETGGGILHSRTKRSNFPNQSGGQILSFGISAKGTVGQTTNNVGPLVIVKDFAPSPVKTVGGKAVFGTGASMHLTHNRKDEATGIRHIIRVPGNYDPAVGAPVVLWCHQTDSGDANNTISDTRISPIANALLTNGYIVASSDNGTTQGPGGTNDKFGNQEGLNDYIALVKYVRENFVTQKLFLLGASQGGLFVNNLVGRQELGRIAGAYIISSAATLVDMPYPSAFDSRVWAAYGVSSREEFLQYVVANDLDPGLHAVWAYRGIPYKAVINTADTTAPPNTTFYPWANRVGPHLAELDIVTTAGSHFDPEGFQQSQVVAFFEKYRYS